MVARMEWERGKNLKNESMLPCLFFADEHISGYFSIRLEIFGHLKGLDGAS